MIDLKIRDYRGCEELATLYFVRHGATKGNLEKRYIGCYTDEPLCEKGIRQVLDLKRSGVLPKETEADILITSPMLRCRQTLGALYPHGAKNVFQEFRESDFGDFENKNYDDLKDDPAYQAWINSSGRLPFPNGESRDDTKRRISEGFAVLTNSIEAAYEDISQTSPRKLKIVLCVHGGTIMSVLSTYGYGDYYDYQCGNASGFAAEFYEDGDGLPLLADIRPLDSEIQVTEVFV